MAYPTQITITSGKTVYAGSPEDGEGITSRQVQVSVTYQMERADDDLLHVTAMKAKEVDAAQEAVWRQVNREQTELRMDGADLRPGDDDAPPHGGAGPDGDWPDGGPPDGAMDEGVMNDGIMDDEAVDGEEPPFYGGGGSNGDGSGGGVTPPPYQPGVQGVHSCRAGNGHHGAGPPGTAPVNSERVPQSIRKPQKLAIEAQARRLGLSDEALAGTIQERFGKASYTPRFAVDKLTKAEADALLRALQALGRGDGRPVHSGQSLPA